MRLAVVLLVLLPCIALAGFRSLINSINPFKRDGCNIPGGDCKKSGKDLSTEHQQLLNWGLGTAALQQRSLKGFTLKKVNSFSSQVVAGMKYEFDITVVNTEGEKRHVVLSIFDQPWTNTKDLTILTNVAVASKKKDGCNIPGGVCKKSDEKLSKKNQELVQWGINAAIAQQNSLQGFKLERVNTYSSQVVAGTMYEFDIVVVNGGEKRNVVFKIFDQPWTKTRELTIVKNVAFAEETHGCNIPGGVCKKTGDDLSEESKEILEWGIKQAISQENSLQGFTLEKVNSHSEQVVAGSNYIYEVTLVNGGQKRRVEIKIFDQPWTNTRQLTILKNEAL